MEEKKLFEEFILDDWWYSGSYEIPKKDAYVYVAFLEDRDNNSLVTVNRDSEPDKYFRLSNKWTNKYIHTPIL